jgi:hypothetical protein
VSGIFDGKVRGASSVGGRRLEWTVDQAGGDVTWELVTAPSRLTRHVQLAGCGGSRRSWGCPC